MYSADQYISKGCYSHSQIEGFISVKNYIIMSRQEQNYLLLRFENMADFTAEAMEFTLVELDSAGTVLNTSAHSFRELSFAPGTTYTPREGIPIHKFCTDFKLQFSAVYSDRYTYRVKENAVTVFYTPVSSEESAATSPEDAIEHFSVKPLKRGKYGLAVLCGILTLLLLFALSAYGLYDRYQNALEESKEPTNPTYGYSYDDIINPTIPNYPTYEYIYDGTMGLATPFETTAPPQNDSAAETMGRT